jgi:hypothetical protein
MDMQKQLSALALLTGIVLVGVSLILGQGRSAWTPEQAQNYSEAAADLHRLTYEAAQIRESAGKAAPTQGIPKDDSGKRPGLPADAPMPPDPQVATPERAEFALAAARTRYNAARAALDDARDHGRGGATFVRWLGIGLMVAGIGGLIAGGSRINRS